MDRLKIVASALEQAADCNGLPDPPADLLNGAAEQPTPRERVARIVRTIEADIIPRLVRAHRPADPGDETFRQAQVAGALAAEVPAFAQRLLSDDDRRAESTVDNFLAEGMPVERLCLDLLGPAAVELGRLWDDDRCSFSDVTVGVGRLQRMMRRLGPLMGQDVALPVHGRRALLLPAPGEQHTFGVSIVAEFFRRDGWDVAGHPDQRGDPASLVHGEWFDLVGLSVGTRSRLEALRSGIATIRQASRNREIAVMVGGPSLRDRPGLGLDLGADLVALDGGQAPLMAEQWLRSRAVGAGLAQSG
jgi:methanogenic corrinoid protein MtbC1